MKWFTTAAKSKFVLGLCAALALSLVVASPVMGAATDTFGIEAFGEETELGNEDVRTTVAQIINVALSLLGVVAVVIVIAAGFKWMTAGGDDEKVGAAKKLLSAGVIGLAIILSAFAITRFVFGQLQRATNSGEPISGFEG